MYSPNNPVEVGGGVAVAVEVVTVASFLAASNFENTAGRVYRAHLGNLRSYAPLDLMPKLTGIRLLG